VPFVTDTEGVNVKRTTAMIWAWLCHRAWSRAGAVAAVVSTGPTRRLLTFSTRLILLIVGSFIISASVAITLWNQLGPGPLDVFIGAVRMRTGLPLSVALWVTVGSLLCVSWLLGRRPGLGTVLSPFMIGPMIQALVAGLSQFAVPDSLGVRIAFHLVAIIGIGLGAGALIASGLGAGSGELLASAASDRVGHPETKVRFAIEMTWIVAGVALGGPAGLGTVLVALFVGPAVAHGYRIVDSVVAASIRGAVNTHSAIIARELAAAR
jgi:uncharacterized protein